ncbi:hypothetical protein HYT51_02845 [Candidatus Woesearchaeota archaeon]|nr:hypothetical protein [Candidatus Woesearchaeota archaeon]
MSACTNKTLPPSASGKCELSNTKGCDRSCNADNDCKELCGGGCINIHEQFDPKGAEIDCTPPEGCHCVNNLCTSKIISK